MSVELRDGGLAVSGPVTLQTVQGLVARGDSLVSQGAARVDLAGVQEVDSAVLAMLLHWTRAARSAGRDLAVTGVPASVRSLARLYDLESLVLGP